MDAENGALGLVAVSPEPSVAAGFAYLRAIVLASVASEHSKRNYAKALDNLFAQCEAAGGPLSRPVLLQYRAGMLERGLSASTVNVRLSAVRNLIGEALRAGMIDPREAENLTSVPNMRQRGNRTGNWLTRDQAKALLAVPDRSTIKGKRDYVIFAMLLACGLRRRELAQLDVDGIQQREGRWVIVDLRGKGGRLRTVAIPLWVKHAINAWMIAAKIEDGRLLRPLSKGGKVLGGDLGELGDAAIAEVVTLYAGELGIERLAPHDLRRTCAKLCRKAGGDLEQIKFLLGHSSIQTTERYLGSEQDLAVAVNDGLTF